MKELTTIANYLESWMVFVLGLLIILIPIITEILRQVKQSKKDKQFNEFTEKLYNSQLNIYSQLNDLVDVMGKSNKEMYSKLNDLIDILYEKFANNITILVAMDLLELVYTRSKYPKNRNATIEAIKAGKT
jgi:predicted PurR-regulated permease PerM